ncbi:MAG: hypothetical protein Kow0032_22310 [Methyloligellaceae bacterium]
MSRLKRLTAAERTPAQQALFERITASRGAAHRDQPLADEEGRLAGPFNAMLYAPKIGEAAQELGARLRFHSSLPGRLREAAILTVAQSWRAGYEWCAHAPIARREGVAQSDIEAIGRGEPPTGDPDLALVHRFVSRLLEDRRVDAETYQAAVALLGEAGVVELVMITGYYCLISATLNSFEIAPPSGCEPPFDAG